jgi:hypothetical protein
LRRLKLRADGISRLILSTDLPGVDILLAVERLRDLRDELFPGREGLFEMVYVKRFERLWEQFANDRPDAADPFRSR